MATLNRLAVPSFDLAWADLNDGKECLVLIPGGGGSTKSGVRNQIQVAKYDGPRGFALLKSFMTDVEEKSNFCSAISSGIIEGRAIVCAVVDDSCLIFESQRADDGGVDLSKRTEFKADFNKEFASVNCCMVASKHVLTGGEDHICRLWNISWESVGEDEVWNVKQVREMKGHAAPVMAIARHPTRPWVVTASKDGTCKIFDASNGQGTESSRMMLNIKSMQSSSTFRRWMAWTALNGRVSQWSVEAVSSHRRAGSSSPYKAGKEDRVIS